MYQSDVLIHIDEELDDQRIHELEHNLGMREGIFSACVHEGRRHLMLVDYDPEKSYSGDILSQVRASGVHAELIGL
jgi:hypothetical protein